jgi:hypothetical protein
MIEGRSKATRKGSRILKLKLPSLIEMFSRFVPLKTPGAISETDAGSKSMTVADNPKMIAFQYATA